MVENLQLSNANEFTPDKLLYSVSETSRILSLGRTKTYELISDRTLESVRIGSRRLIRASSIEAVANGSVRAS